MTRLFAAFVAGWSLACVALDYTRRLDREER